MDRPTSLTGWLAGIQGDTDARAFFDISPDLLAVVREDGTLHRFNPAWCVTLGYEAQELAGRLFMDLVQFDDQLDHSRLLSLADQNEKLRLHLRSKSGNAIAVGLIAARQREGVATYIILRPVQELEEVCAMCGRVLEAEAVAHRAQHRLRAIIEQAPLGMMLLDRDARILYANQRILKLLDFQLKDVAGTDLFELMQPEQRVLREPLFRQAFERHGELVNDGIVKLRSRWERWRQVEVMVLSLLHDPKVEVVVLYLKEKEAE